MLIKQTLQYGVGRLLPALIYFGLIALYTRLLTPEEYGLYSVVYAAVWTLTGIFFQWLISSAARLSEGGTDLRAVRWALTMGFVLSAALALIAAVPVYVLIGNPIDRALMCAGFALFLATGWFEVVTAMLWAELKADQYAIYGIARALCSGALGAGFAWMGWGAAGIVFGMAIGVALPACAATLRQLHDFRLKPAFPDALRGVTGYGLPLMLSYSVEMLGNTADRYILAAMRGPAVLGQYAAGFELADRTLRSLITPIGSASLPLALNAQAKGGDDAVRDQLAKNFRLLAGILFPAAFGLIAIASDLVSIVVGEEFQQMARQILPITALALLIWGFRSNYFDHAFQLARRTGMTLVVFGIASAVNVMLLVPFINLWGATGAAYSMVAGQAAGLVACIVVGRRVFAMPVPFVDLFKICGSALAMLLVLTMIPAGSDPLRLLLKIACGGLVYALGLIGSDLGGIRALLADRLSMRISAR